MRFINRAGWGVALMAGAALLLFVWFARDVLLLGFAGILLALVFRTPAEWLSARVPIPTVASVGLVILLLTGIIVGAFWLRGSDIRQQFNELRERVPQAAQQLQARIERTEIGREVLERAPDAEELVPESGGVEQATGAVSSTFRMLINAVVILFLGIVLALAPKLYVDNALRLVPISRRPRARELMDTLNHTLRWWLLGRLISMTVIGVSTGIGLWLLGIPLASLLGLLAALLSFIPNLGPILSAVPAILLGLMESPEKAVSVILLYLGVQAVESYLLDPIIDRKTVYLPPALTVLAQLTMAIFAGLLGVALATPLAAAAVVIVRMLYVEDVLGDRVEVGRATRSPPPH